ncbi:diaminopropionate ammonia-lyase [Desulfosarcina sp.]|uniref:diaminopropionate ammonia-lyase n=1 Tax=Desulfosarcina sp. TaxID=2027861 RepID=UPI0035618677
MLQEISTYGIRYVLTVPAGHRKSTDFNDASARQALRFHRTIPGYQPTRLVRLPNLARRWGVGEILVKDESTRFRLNAFKVLGGSHAVARLLCNRLGIPLSSVDFNLLMGDDIRHRIGQMTLVAATDGNHGRGVAWAAEQLGLKAVVFMPKGSAKSRVDNIRAHGATVQVTDLNYDDTVRLAGRMAKENGWQIIQDTASQGDTDIPRWIMQGYTTMSMEAVGQMGGKRLPPTHVFLQAGVGSFAAAMVAHLAAVFRGESPRFIVVEPSHAACLLASAAAGDGRPHAVTGDLDTIMAGLACGEPSPIAWEILCENTSAYISCDDYVAANGMRILANPLAGDDRIEAGESGAVGIGLLDLLANLPDCIPLKAGLDIGPHSRILFFNTEGGTDPEGYRQILWYGKYPFNARTSEA